MLNSPRDATLTKTEGAKSGPAVLRRAPLAVSALAALAAAGVFISGGTDLPRAHAEAPAGATVETPYGRAPLSFADLVDRVKPSVVSISVVNDGGAPGKGTGDGSFVEMSTTP